MKLITARLICASEKTVTPHWIKRRPVSVNLWPIYYRLIKYVSLYSYWSMSQYQTSVKTFTPTSRETSLYRTVCSGVVLLRTKQRSRFLSPITLISPHITLCLLHHFRSSITLNMILSWRKGMTLTAVTSGRFSSITSSYCPVIFSDIT